MRIIEDKLLFWKEEPFSNFTKCRIVGPNNIAFTSSEQMFMWAKAMFFNDVDVAKKILLTTSCDKARQLGRQVKNYEEDRWSRVRYSIMLFCVYEKFRQNSEFLTILADFRNKGLSFVEAAYYDKIWGIGFSEDKAEANMENWGKNLLGNILNVVADSLKDATQNDKSDVFYQEVKTKFKMLTKCSQNWV